jgi:hypothetical protein
MKMYEKQADGTVTKTTTMNNTQMVLGSLGMLGGLYYAFTMKKGFWGYVGFGVLGSIAGGLVGNILGGVSQTTTSNNPPTQTQTTTPNTPTQYGPGTGIGAGIPQPSKQSFSMDSVSAIC